MAGGRPTAYDAEVQLKADEYIDDDNHNGDVVPTAAGLAVYLGVSKKTLYNWAKDYPEFLHSLERLNTKQERDLVKGGLSNEFNSTIAKLILHNHDYSDKQEVTGKDGQPLFDAEAKEKSKAAIRQVIPGGANTGAGQ